MQKERCEHMLKLGLNSLEIRPPVLSSSYLHSMKTIAYQNSVEESPILSKRLCVKCSSFLVPGCTCSVQVRRKTADNLAKLRASESRDGAEKKSKLKNVVIYSCNSCSFKNVFPGTTKSKAIELKKLHRERLHSDGKRKKGLELDEGKNGSGSISKEPSLTVMNSTKLDGKLTEKRKNISDSLIRPLDIQPKKKRKVKREQLKNILDKKKRREREGLSTFLSSQL